MLVKHYRALLTVVAMFSRCIRVFPRFSTFPHVPPAHTGLLCQRDRPWKQGGCVAGEVPRIPNTHIIQYIPIPPMLRRATREPDSARDCSTRRIGWTWKLMCTRERATPREHRLARCSRVAVVFQDSNRSQGRTTVDTATALHAMLPSCAVAHCFLTMKPLV